MRTTVHNAEPLPVSHYWGLIKDIDDSQKLELASLLIDSLKPLAAKAAQDDPLRPYTMAEINAMLDEAEADFAAGKGIPHEESMRRWREKIALKKQELEMAEAV